MLPLLSPSDTTIALDNGSLTRTRLASTDDYVLAEDLHTRCSPGSRARRYAGGKPGLTLAEWSALTQRPNTYVLLTTPQEDPDRTIAMTSLAELGSEPGVGDVAILIADQAPENYQSLGLGTALAELAADLARTNGFHTMSVTTSETNWRALSIVEHLGGPALPQTAHLRDMALLGVRPDASQTAKDVDLRINL